ncbi:hypothetical protein EMIHUDRAFT_453577 [Emiliania huxleyi CCMP1516]|uniref:Helicase C-terminal domain-containing protein n=2 Tax=Emiliania huxleyi TaxID=2903 RepID=A0A0D3I3X9_EMIH1|nr:hypothetical protein EMIHUDRAFT_453577 [Emiliania huxleyi CCMP1516]EOD05964.1 hypothetical protein EMIHUDRAFT_453577 [Emiliania huxleyi CCMP1516]|eukprot:XP_005758393.1 hypothetical protein EMIHUDRAFT_453577 [Emiliania huxleyi CCMP1516]
MSIRQLVLWNPPLSAQPTCIPEGKGVPQPEDEQPEGGRGPSQPRRGRGAEGGGGGESVCAYNEGRRGASEGGGGGEGRRDGHRMSPNIEGAVLFAELVRAGLKTICFCSVRKICELVLSYAQQHLRASDERLAGSITAYRGGLNATDRRRIERQLYDGTVRGVTATSTLELGVDIAALDAIVMVGFPGSWVVRHPARVLSMPLEAAVVDIDNHHILGMHLLCAAAEEPLSAAAGDRELFGERRYDEALKALAAAERVIPIAENPGSWRAHPLVEGPAQGVNIRAIEPDLVRVVHRFRRRRSQPRIAEAIAGGGGGAEAAGEEEGEETIDEVERWRVYYEYFEGAVFLNQGRKFVVTSLDLGAGVALVAPTDVRYYTAACDSTSILVQQRLPLPAAPLAAKPDGAAAGTSAGGCEALFGRVRVRLAVRAYLKIWQTTGEAFEEVPLALPPKEYDTRACWIDLQPDAWPRRRRLVLTDRPSRKWEELAIDLEAGLHAAAHALLAVTPLRLSCKPADLGCECEAFKERKLRSKRLLLFDRCVGGIGLTERVATAMPELLRSALELMTSCDCDDGCWLCVHSSVCTEYNACTSKKAAIAAEPRAPPPGSSEEAPSMLGRSIGIFRSMAMSQSRSRGGT